MPVKKKKATKKANSAKAVKKSSAPKKAKIEKISPSIKVEEVIVTTEVNDIENQDTFEETQTSEDMSIPSYASQAQSMKFKKSQLIGLGVIVIIIVLLYVFRSQFIVATVNGEPISRVSYNNELEKEAGQKSMDSLVTKILILQEANKEHVSISDDEINKQIDTIKKQLSQQGESLDQALKSQNLTMDDLKDQIKVSQLVQKMLEKDTTVTDKDVNDYLAKLQQQSQQDQSANPSLTPTPAPSKDEVKKMLQQEKLTSKFQPWLQSLKQKAKISYFVNTNS